MPKKINPLLLKKHDRLLALDGIRGFAAISVVISHIGFNTRAFTDSPVVSTIFRMFSAGPTSVQLFFVLSGFLMAYLYPTVKEPLSFWKKRYLRIMPVYGIVVVALWLSKVYFFNSPSWVGIGLLILVALSLHLCWLAAIKVQHLLPKTANYIFFSFLVLQLSWLVFSLFSSLGPGAKILESFDLYQKNFFHMISNLTMTMYLQKDLVVLEGVFWSLVPEMLFYSIYPIVVVPLLVIGKQLRFRWNIVLVATVLLVLFQLDVASRALFSLHGIFLSRASGFILGLILGSIYLSKGLAWQKISTLIAKPYVSTIAIILFGVTMALEWPDRYHQIRLFVMLHYLILSVSFTLILATALIRGSLVERIFAKRVFVFLGMISYSLYLTHTFVIQKLDASIPLALLHTKIPEQAFFLFRGALALAASVLVATVLYYLIEKLYFRKWVTAPHTNLKDSRLDVLLSKLNKKKIIALGTVTIVGVYATLYATDAAPSLLLSRHSISTGMPLIRLTGENTIFFEFTAAKSHLSAIQLAMDYAHDPNVAKDNSLDQPQLIFTLSDESGVEIVRSVRHPQELEGEPLFPFGFPTQEGSQGHKYTIQLALASTNPTDEVVVYAQTGIVSQYTTDHIQLTPQKLVLLFSERLRFALWRWESLLFFGMVGVVVTLLLLRDSPTKH